MLAAVYYGMGQVRVEERPRPILGEGQVLLRLQAAGICGSDMQIFAGTHPRAKIGLVPGHEVFGRIEDANGTGWKKGERVVIYPLISCGKCSPCLNGNSYVCEHLGLVGIDRDGGFAEFVVADEHQLVLVPDSIPDSDAGIVEPLAVAVHAIQNSDFRIGDTVLVIGAGPIGNLLTQTLHAAGATQIVVSEVLPFRRQLLASLGFAVFDPLAEPSSKALERLIGRSRADIVFEATGHSAAYQNAIDCCAVRGQISLVGIPKTIPSLDVQGIIFKELRLSSARVYRRRDYDAAIALLSREALKVAALITDRVPLSQAPRAYKLMKSAAASGKIVIEPD